MPTTLTWNGHSNFRLECAEAAILIDPFFDGNPAAPVSASEAGRADIVCVTHDHDDHVGSALDLCLATGAKLVAMFDICVDMTAKGLPGPQAVGMNIGGSVELHGCRIKMVQAMHSSRTGAAAGFIITMPDGLRVYHSGDTGLFASMELFGLFAPIHVALLPIDGRFNMDANDAAYACKLLKPQHVAPMHWGTFPILAQNTDDFRKALARIAPDTRLLTLRPGEKMALPSPPAVDDCGCE